MAPDRPTHGWIGAGASVRVTPPPARHRERRLCLLCALLPRAEHHRHAMTPPAPLIRFQRSTLAPVSLVLRRTTLDVGITLQASAIPVTSAAFVLESPTPPDPKDPIRCGSFEFVPHLKPPHSIPAESCDDMTATFGGVHFIIDSGGFLRLPRTNTSGSRLSVSADDTLVATLEIPPRSAHGGSRGSFDPATGRKKRRRDLHHGEEERTTPHPRQSEQGQEGAQSLHGRVRSPYLSATEQLDAPCYLHSYIDPKDGREKSSHLLRNCRHFLEIRQFCDDLRSEAISRVHIMEKRARSHGYWSEPYVPEPYEPMEKDEYVPAEIFPEPRGQVNMIHKTSFSKREIKKFSREVKYAEVAMVDTPEFIDWSEQSISFDRTDHPKAVPRPGHAALVLEAQIGGKEKIEFEVVDWESQYHAILGRPAFAKFMAVPHYAYLKMKMPGNNGTPITVHGSFARSDTCDREFQKIASKFGAKEELNAIDAAVDHTQPPADNRNVRSDEFDATKEAKKLQEGALIEFLRERWEIFAWEPSDMPGFIRELKESEWVANPVMVPKKDTTALRMCIDYTGLNKHCPKDHFPLPRIDQIVDSTAGCDRLSFLDAYSGYNQIKLKKEDQELTAFITPHGIFCYNAMTFGLKNAGATYQRCMQACLESRSGETSKSILTISW
ncbi:hypothetical protein QYE76_057246 [Lolium multiflorum]|uniref:Reverse transcriptase domain-containing protein n=1 Tax=Lolium multiflorum TaxID=4521 RepID=A0AAD8T313_LOLMU|nr:hypothetical protein QYE76_057246 [Lolium multiflorum]